MKPIDAIANNAWDDLFAWFGRGHAALSKWVASTSWRQLALLFVVVMVSKGIIGEQLSWSFAQRLARLLTLAILMLSAYLVMVKIIVSKTAESTEKAKAATDLAQSEAMSRQLVQARLKLMQAQIEPHFLFNTLAAIDYLIETDPPRASVMQKTLIAYLRAALPQMREGSSQLGREIDLIRPYLELLKMRIEDRLEFAFNVPTGLRTAVFPPMMLQTLVENAIQHGIEPKTDGGRITVSAEVNHGKLWVEVLDTGVGLSESSFAKQAAAAGLAQQKSSAQARPDGGPSAAGGLGLNNIRDRLNMLYPWESHLDLLPAVGGGTLARIVIPYLVGGREAPTSNNMASAATTNGAGEAAAP